MGVGVWEFWRMYSVNEANRSNKYLIIALTLAIICTRYFFGFESASRLLTGCVFIAMLWAVRSYDKHNLHAANGFAVMVTGFVYFGWIGSYLLTLRNLENGFWWVMVCLLIIWLSDSGAFFIGSRFGRHAMSPLVSPKKTWEGYFGGILTAMLTGWLLVRFVPIIAEILNQQQMFILALLLSVIASLGDFGESMIKRTFGFKDSSNLIPGHGGFFDRLDTVLWAMPIGYLVYRMINSGLI